MADIAKGTVLNGRYELSEPIGRGGMAEVWKGRDTVLGRDVAVKIMLPQFALDPEFVNRFRQEAASAANLANPYIVNIYDWGHDGDIQFIVMEYVKGQDLKHLVASKGALPPKSAAKIGAQICRALTTAHNQDIVHRDIKPQNIMIQPNGSVKVMDFGISRAKNSTEQKTQMVLGTAQYVSPEQAQGLDIDAASDIYSLGIVLYESVTGKLPFDGEDALSVALKQVEADPVPPSHINRNVDPVFESIILRALEKDPEARFLSVQEMYAALDSYANGRQDLSSAATRVMGRVSPTADIPPTSAIPPISGNPRADGYGNAGYADDKKMSKGKKIAIVAAVAVVLAIIAGAVAFVLLSPKTVSVPDVTGLDEASAVAAVEKAGLVAETADVPNAEIPAGYVVGTDPAAGADAEQGSRIVISVSSGPGEVTVPDITGMSEEQAQKLLEALGLSGKRDADVHSPTVAEGLVAQQSPAKDEVVEAGSTVVYAISLGSDTVTVPDLSGMDEEQAMEALRSAGLTGLVGSRQASSDVKEGKVISQNPAKDLKVEEGTQITFTVSTGKPTIPVPALTGLTQQAARSTLVNAGFELGEVKEEYSDEPKGTVISQTIGEGEEAREGTKIGITISKGEDPDKKKDETDGGTQGSGADDGNGGATDGNGNTAGGNAGAQDGGTQQGAGGGAQDGQTGAV